MKLTKEEFQGLVGCMSQLTNVSVRLVRDGQVVTVSREDFVAGLAGLDSELARKAQAWMEAANALNAHIFSRTGEALPPADPFELSPAGHVL